MSTKDNSPDKSTGTNCRNARNQPHASDLTHFQVNILIILAEEDKYGLAIKRDLETYYGTEVNHGRLYPNLDDLVEMGLVEKTELDKRTNNYSLTSAGEHLLRNRAQYLVGSLDLEVSPRGESESNAVATDGGEM
ncbi:PadR family transcriptional regulator [Haloferax elongans ATCC BAA-1513]|uniref:PadR family transcriptional regulator n=1 Tax=Haloferax elongans ATCC BAA-1513 TaxID=1230453 RepID=M0HL35_HALEO|nr:PadR family transcriptional regulator [Haloferax elongans]ELZ84432.1 PadR family transcriptional regulator [Haloferax elongans ATCC BAA-1513]